MTEKVLQPLPTGTSDFETLRGRGQIYVDKTHLIYELANRTEKFFPDTPSAIREIVACQYICLIVQTWTSVLLGACNRKTLEGHNL